MDPVTAMTIDKGQKNTRLLVQALHEPMAVEKQVAVLYCGTNGLLSNVPINKVQDFEKEFLMVLELSHQADVLDVLKKGVINDDVTAIIEKVAAEVAKRVAVNA
jgi:F-type H+/Na+-transporting ATPase subunit alpha